MDNPDLHPSMSFTFFTNMTPITAYTAEPTVYEMAPETSILASPPDSPSFYNGPMPAPMEARTSHGKKRDASYIPRPPNAFILFRSSFIRSQQVPGKVEGNHSTLSKIIGEPIRMETNYSVLTNMSRYVLENPSTRRTGNLGGPSTRRSGGTQEEVPRLAIPPLDLTRLPSSR